MEVESMSPVFQQVYHLKNTTSDKNKKSWLTAKHRVVSYSNEKFKLPLSFAHDVANWTALNGANAAIC